MVKYYQFRLKSILLTLLTIVLFKTSYSYAGNNIVATVNGEAITEEALNVEINKKLPLASYHSQISEEKLKEFRDNALEKLIEEELLYFEAKKQKLSIKQAEVDQQVAMMKSGYASEKEFQHELANSRLNIKSLRDRLERHLLIEKIRRIEILGKAKVTDSDLNEYFKANKSKFNKPQQLHVRHILISVNPGAMTAGWHNGLEKAQQICSRIASGEDFAHLAVEFSDDSTSRAIGGDLGWFHKGQLIPELEEVIEKMKIGDVSEPVRSIYGFHILKYEAMKPEKQLTFDEINLEKLKTSLIKKRIESRQLEFLANLKAKANIQIYK